MDQKMPERTPTAATVTAKRPYQPPQVMVMDESEVLKVFQITSAGVSWWG
jgi:hypothetical protein